jgi:hypothetical protein
VWSANILLPASIPSYIGAIIAAPIGVSQGLNQDGTPAAFLQSLIPVPSSCTVSNFSASVYGAQNTSSLDIEIGSATPAQIADIGVSVSEMCTITANNGSAVSCTSNTQIPVTPAVPIFIYVNLGTATRADYEGATLLTSFQCQ